MKRHVPDRHVARARARATLPASTILAPVLATAALGLLVLRPGPAAASPFLFSTGSVTNQIGIAARVGPDTGPNQDTEAADDFIVSAPTQINSATFAGLLPSGVPLSSVRDVTVQIYQLFPNNSDPARTPNVPTRMNSPADVAFASRESFTAGLTYTTTQLSSSFTANNSVDTGINPSPTQATGGEGPRTGQEVRVSTNFTPIDLPTDHYFFVPQVTLEDETQHFLWLSASRPIDATGTPFMPDLQAWVRNAQLDPDWLRVGADIVGAGTFNAAFTLAGETTDVPEPGALALLGAGLVAVGLLRRRPA